MKKISKKLKEFAAKMSFKKAEKLVEDAEARRVRKDAEENEGMWCRMCGGACDLKNCGMEQP